MPPRILKLENEFKAEYDLDNRRQNEQFEREREEEEAAHEEQRKQMRGKRDADVVERPVIAEEDLDVDVARIPEDRLRQLLLKLARGHPELDRDIRMEASNILMK